MKESRIYKPPASYNSLMPGAKPRQPKANRKPEIVAAAHALLRERGLSGVTTRAIAERVPCSEGAIYVHFASRIQVLLAVLEHSLPDMLIPLHALEGKAGSKTPQRNLTIAMRGLQAFHNSMAPVLGSLFAEPELLKAFRQALHSQGKGPHGGVKRIVRYIEQEQQLQRIDPAIDAPATAASLMSLSFFQAFTEALFGEPTPAMSAKRVVDSLLPTLYRPPFDEQKANGPTVQKSSGKIEPSTGELLRLT